VAAADTESVLEAIDDLLDRANLAWDDRADEAHFRGFDTSWQQGLLTSWAAAIERLSAPGSAYIDQARALLKFDGALDARLFRLHGVIVALRLDYERGYLRSIEELIHADVFSDFLDMAQELEEKEYIHPAAVLAGIVLEENLRKMSTRFGITMKAGSSPKSADTLNAELVKSGAYNKLEQKTVTALLGLRNEAAHGRREEYDRVQVRWMIQSVRDFVTRHAA
jgi:hypothetical protein